MYIDSIFYIKDRGYVIDLHLFANERIGSQGSCIRQGEHEWRLIGVSHVRFMKTLDLAEITSLNMTIKPVDGAPESPEVGEVVNGQAS